MTQSVSFTLIFDWERQLSDFSFFDIGSHPNYYSDEESISFKNWYQQEGEEHLEQLVNTRVPVSIYFSGPFLQLLDQIAPEAISRIKSAVDQSKIEVIGGTYHHSLSSLYAMTHFSNEVNWHLELLKSKFGIKPNRFYNTENIYYTGLVDHLHDLGFSSCFAGAIAWYLNGHSQRRIFTDKGKKDFKLFLVSNDQGQALFEDNEITNHFIQLDQTQLATLGGWSDIIRKVSSHADIVSLKSQTSDLVPVYHAKHPVSGSYRNLTIEDFTTHPLQDSWLKQLYSSNLALADSPEHVSKEWSSLGATSHLLKLGASHLPHEADRNFEYYTTLINILNDIQLRS